MLQEDIPCLTTLSRVIQHVMANVADLSCVEYQPVEIARLRFPNEEELVTYISFERPQCLGYWILTN